MPYDLHQARQLTSRTELELVRASFPPSLDKLSERALKSNAARARELRDKHRDLFRRQRLATRARTGTKQGTRPPSNARTAQKAELFAEVLSRFTDRVAHLRRAEKPTRKPAPRKPRPAAKGKGPKPRSRSARKTRGQAALLQKARSPRMKAMQAHVASRGRRRQARRDAR